MNAVCFAPSARSCTLYRFVTPATISDNIVLGNSSRIQAVHTAEMGNSIYSIQLALESCILGMVVLAFFVVGGRCACLLYAWAVVALSCTRTHALHFSLTFAYVG
jgi:hypothetical protein